MKNLIKLLTLARFLSQFIVSGILVTICLCLCLLIYGFANESYVDLGLIVGLVIFTLLLLPGCIAKFYDFKSFKAIEKKVIEEFNKM